MRFNMIELVSEKEGFFLKKLWFNYREYVDLIWFNGNHVINQNSATIFDIP